MDDTETIQVVTEKDGFKFEEKEQIIAVQTQNYLCQNYRCPRNSFMLY